MIDYYAEKVRRALQNSMQVNTLIMGLAVGVLLGILLVQFKVIGLG